MCVGLVLAGVCTVQREGIYLLQFMQAPKLILKESKPSSLQHRSPVPFTKDGKFPSIHFIWQSTFCAPVDKG